MTHILYLAAGNSRRFGENKLLYPLDGKPLYRHGLDTLAAAAQQRTDCTLTVDGAAAQHIRTVYSPESEKGLSYTIRAGVGALDLQQTDFILCAAADQPYLSVQTVLRLLDAARPGVACARVCWGEQRGNPALFSAALVPALRALTGDEGGRVLLRRGDCVPVFAASARELWDVDTKAQLCPPPQA